MENISDTKKMQYIGCVVTFGVGILLALQFYLWIIPSDVLSSPSFNDLSTFFEGKGAPVDPGRVAHMLPDQEFRLDYNLQLKVFDTREGWQSPVVQLINTETSAILWTISTIPEPQEKYADYQKPIVRRIRFKELERPPLRMTRIYGTVDWLMGMEDCYWFFERDGALISFYYSW